MAAAGGHSPFASAGSRGTCSRSAAEGSRRVYSRAAAQTVFLACDAVRPGSSRLAESAWAAI